MPSKDTNIGAKRAREAREAFGLGTDDPVACLLSVVEATAGVPVVVTELPNAVAGCCWRHAHATILWVNGAHPDVRQRFTLAHELGHLRCGHDTGTTVETWATLSGKSTDSHEVQANAFAAEFLVPEAALRDRLEGAPPDLDVLVLLAAAYGVSTVVALYRLNTLEMVGDGLRDELQASIDNGAEEQARRRLVKGRRDDVIGGLAPDRLPRLSPALEGTALAAMIEGTASVESAAHAAGADPERLAAAAPLVAGGA